MGSAGRLRPVWALLLTALLAALALVGIPLAVSWGLGALFAVWNLSASTVARAPAWAQALYAASGWIVTLSGPAALIAAGEGAARLCRVEAAPRERGCWKRALWALPPLAVTGLLLAVDSLRLQNPLASPQFGAAWLALLAARLLTSAAEGIWFQRLLYGLLARSGARRWARGIAAALFALCAAWRADAAPLLAINMLLLGGLLLKRGGSATGFAIGRFSFRLTTELLLAPAGGGALYALLDVSEDALTGGALGVAAGGALTVVLILALAAENRHRLRQWRQRLAARRRKPEYTSGKRNKRPA